MYNFKKYILFKILLSFLLSNGSYQGLLLPINSYMLLNSSDSYFFVKSKILKDDKYPKISSNLILLPQDINISSFNYSYNLSNAYLESNFTIIDYGDFIDSESEYKFSSKDLIFSNKVLFKINRDLYSSSELRYINTNIDIYDAHALTMDLNLYYQFNDLILTGFIKNYGFVINDYTSYEEDLPQSHGFNLNYKPKNLNSILSIYYQSFDSYSEFNIYNEIFFKNSSIGLGYSSIATGLYEGDFNYDFFTGLSLGFSTYYNNFLLNIGVKNLGSAGLVNSISLIKLVN